MISVLRFVFGNNADSEGCGTPKRPSRGRLFPILAVLGSLFLALPAFGQATQNTTIQPDCLIPFTFTATANFPVTTTTGGAGDNRTKGCAAWTLMYQSTGFSGVSIQLNSGASPTTTVSFGAFAGTISSGYSNPLTSTTGASLQATNGTAAISWVQVAATLTGSGTVNGVLYGFRLNSAAVSGGSGGNCNGLLGDTTGPCSATITGKMHGGTQAVAFASLGTPADGTFEFCSDCTVTSSIDNTCAASGGGAMASRLGGAWKCGL